MRAAVEAGLESAAFVELVMALCSELKTLCEMQETVTRPAGLLACGNVPRKVQHSLFSFLSGVADAESFQLELRGFLQELSCPYADLTSSLNPLSSFSPRLQLVGQ